MTAELLEVSQLTKRTATLPKNDSKSTGGLRHLCSFPFKISKQKTGPNNKN